MSDRVEIEYALTVNTEDASTQIRQLERLLFRTISLLRRMGLPEEVDAAIQRIQRLIMLLRQLQITMNLFYAATGPVGWAIAGVGAVSTIMSFAEFGGALENDLRGR